jgi:DNA-binding Lrp family transcriptional regulator
MSSSTIRALHILDEVANSDRPLGVSEIARALSLPPGTVFRSLDALLRAGFVARYRASARYVPGPATERLHRSIIARFPVREVCLPYLRQLVSISGETASLHVRTGWYEVRICSVPGTGEVATMPAAGEAHALSESPAGQAILAFLPKREVAHYRAWSESATPPGNRFTVGKSGRRSNSPQQNPFISGATGNANIPTVPSPEHSLLRPSLKGRVGPGVIAFPVRTSGRAIGAITIDGLSPSMESADKLSACKQVISNIEVLALAQPPLFANPFAHLDPNSLTL